MHELSIAEAIVDVATRHAAGRRVVRVEVKVGHLRQVVPDSLHLPLSSWLRARSSRARSLPSHTYRRPATVASAVRRA